MCTKFVMIPFPAALRFRELLSYSLLPNTGTALHYHIIHAGFFISHKAIFINASLYIIIQAYSVHRLSSFLPPHYPVIWGIQKRGCKFCILFCYSTTQLWIMGSIYILWINCSFLSSVNGGRGSRRSSA